MDIRLQICLIVLSVLTFLFLISNVRKGKMRSDYALGWIFFSIILIILSIFPQIAYFFSRLLGIISTANMIFAIIIFLLLVLVYILFLKVSNLEEKQKNLIQYIAMMEKKQNDKKE